MFHFFRYWNCIGRKLNLILKLKVATLNEQISYSFHTVLLQILSAIFLPNIIGFTFHIVIMKVIWVNFIETAS